MIALGLAAGHDEAVEVENHEDVQELLPDFTTETIMQLDKLTMSRANKILQDILNLQLQEEGLEMLRDICEKGLKEHIP
jgi:hypothetical protein